MGVLLYHEEKDTGNMVGMAEARIAGEHTPARQYQHEGPFLHVNGPSHALDHDVEEILKLPGYRLATAAEQEQYAATKRKRTRLTEKGE